MLIFTEHLLMIRIRKVLALCSKNGTHRIQHISEVFFSTWTNQTIPSLQLYKVVTKQRNALRDDRPLTIVFCLAELRHLRSWHSSLSGLYKKKIYKDKITLLSTLKRYFSKYWPYLCCISDQNEQCDKLHEIWHGMTHPVSLPHPNTPKTLEKWRSY
jgi:hypothetical protein